QVSSLFMYVFIAIRKQKLAGSLAAAAVSVACAGATRPPSASSLWGRRARATAGVLAPAFPRALNPSRARGGEILYPTEKVSCLRKFWPKACFHYETCKMTLHMKNYKGYEKKPRCNAHYPTESFTTAATARKNNRGEGPRATELEAQIRDEEGKDAATSKSLLLPVGGCADPCLALFISGLSCHPSGSPPPIFTPSPLTQAPRLTSLHPCALPEREGPAGILSIKSSLL
ncbi:hypothetical protein DBR06_SOUSAS4310061, partial [Sousa chinensis]